MTKHLFLVFTRPSPGREDEYNDWYDNEHLADVLKVPGVTAAQRFSLAPKFLTPDNLLHGYLAIYEIESEDPQAALDAISGAAKDAMYISPALDVATAQTFLAKPISRRVAAEPEA